MKWKMPVRVSVLYYTSAIFIIFGNILCTEGRERINSHLCGRSSPSGRIIHGHQTSKEEVPWIVHLVLMFIHDGARTCGGSLIAPSYVLTAAHCVYHRKTGETAHRVYVNYNSSEVDRGPRAVADKIRVHPTFKRQGAGKHGFDIAVLKLNTPLDFDNYVRPVCLPVLPTKVLGIPLQIAGWGAWEYGQHAVVLRSALTRGMEYPECDQILKFREIGVNKSLIICSHMVGGSTCFGDSGGPLTAVAKNGRSFLLGIAMAGTSCSDYESLSVFTKVHAFVPWIRKQIEILDRKPPKAHHC